MLVSPPIARIHVNVMCRHAAYIGPSLTLADFMLSPQHNLIEQAIHPREMRVGRINADGFGFGWGKSPE